MDVVKRNEKMGYSLYELDTHNSRSIACHLKYTGTRGSDYKNTETAEYKGDVQEMVVIVFVFQVIGKYISKLQIV
jgi:hypothetical protein